MIKAFSLPPPPHFHNCWGSYWDERNGLFLINVLSGNALIKGVQTWRPSPFKAIIFHQRGWSIWGVQDDLNMFFDTRKFHMKNKYTNNMKKRRNRVLTYRVSSLPFQCVSVGLFFGGFERSLPFLADDITSSIQPSVCLQSLSSSLSPDHVCDLGSHWEL